MIASAMSFHFYNPAVCFHVPNDPFPLYWEVNDPFELFGEDNPSAPIPACPATFGKKEVIKIPSVGMSYSVDARPRKSNYSHPDEIKRLDVKCCEEDAAINAAWWH